MYLGFCTQLDFGMDKYIEVVDDNFVTEKQTGESCSCVVRKVTAHFDQKALNIRHQSQNIFEVSLLEPHNNTNVTSSKYLVHKK